jgi:hypothetical protein
MIRDLIITNNYGNTLFSKNFGECHSFGKDVDLFSGFLSAIRMFTESFNLSDIKMITLGDKKMAFHKSKSNVYTIICDTQDEKKDIEIKIEKISEIFERTYQNQLRNFMGEISQFKGFGKILIDMNITQKNCGGRPECVGCPNSTKNLPLASFTSNIWKKLKNKLKKN